MSFRKFLIGVACLSSFLWYGPSLRSEEEGEAGGARVGTGKAVTAANERDGMRLSEEAIRKLGLSFSEVKTRIIHPVPLQGLVYFKDEVGVYRVRGGWFKLIEVKVLAKSAQAASIQSSELMPGDRIVVRGAAFLRAAELDIFGTEKEEDEHAE